jgi:hypothetical protein
MDLPFLIQDMTGYWVRDCAMTTAEQRLIFLAFSQNSRPLGWQMIESLRSRSLFTEIP